MKDIAPKPTRYRNILFRSRLEARTAVALDYCPNVMNWTFEPLTFTVFPQNWDYTPDFKVELYLRGERSLVYLEIKPEDISKEYARVLREVSGIMHYPLFVLTPNFYEKYANCTVVHSRRLTRFDPTVLFSNFEQAFEHAARFRFDLRDN